MMKRLTSFSIVGLLLCCLCFACSTTVLTGSWRDPGYTGGPLKKVLVVSVSQSDLIRRMLEDEFVRQFGEAGIPAASSYALFTVEQLKEQREKVEAEVRGLGFTQVIVTRLVDRRTEEVVQRGTVYSPRFYPGGWNDYYRDSWNLADQPVAYQVEIATIESELFDLHTSNLIWSGVLETEIGGTAMSDSKERVIRSFVTVVLQDIRKGGLL